MQNKKRGRPVGKLKDARLHIMIPAETKNEFQRLANLDGANISVKTCELIFEYIRKHDNSSFKIKKDGK